MKLALGTVQFGLEYGISNIDGQISFDEAKEILSIAKPNNISVLDTASAYGSSESILGNLGVSEFNIVTKFSNSNILKNFTDSIKLLKVNSLDGYIAHNANVLIENQNIWGELLKLKKDGKINKVGYSIYTCSELDKLLELGFIPDLVQVPYNFLDRRFESYFPILKKMGCEIHTRSTFLQGLYFLDVNSLPAFFDPIKPYIKQLNGICPTSQLKAEALLHFCMSNNNIDKVVVGVSSAKELNEIISGMHKGTVNLNEFEVDFNSFPEEILLPYNWPKT